MSTEIKIVYDVLQNKLNAAYRYGLVYTKDKILTDYDFFQE